MNEFRKDLDDYFCKFTFGQFVTLILLELVTLFFVFYLGARFGPDLLGGSKAIDEPAPSVEEKEQKKVDYSFPERLSDGQSGAIQVKPSGVTAEEFEKNPAPVVVPAPERLEPVKVEVEEIKPEPPKVKMKTGLYAVQVGAFRSAGEAADAVEQWKKKGYSTFMTIGEVPNKGTWYRVRIGQFGDKNEAQTFLQRFKEKEKREAVLVKIEG